MIYSIFTWLLALVIVGKPGTGSYEADVSKYVGPLEQRHIFLHLQIPKTHFLTAEPIPLISWLENVGDAVEYYIRNGDGTIELKDSMGSVLRQHATGTDELPPPSKFVPGVGNNRFVSLKPRETTERSLVNLLDYYGIGKALYDFYLEPGKYYVTAKQVRSDTMVFIVEQPTTPEDKEAAELMVQYAVNPHLWGIADSGYTFLTGFVRKFPYSVYTPRALRALCNLLALKTPVNDPELLQECALRLITQFPDSPFIGSAIFDLDISKLTPDQKALVNESLSKTIAVYQGTYEAKQARELLKKLAN